ncbi:MAG: thymidine phosphorylase [Bacilli bacterium]|nr:thymidine phosphorylase [Bacilli bacterium]
MSIIDIITKKKNKKELTYEELFMAFNGYHKSEIKDYQMSSLLMAITINGMTLNETLSLTDIFIKSGKVYNFNKKVSDKHSTGGVGDSTTFIVAPIVASMNIPMAKMSGRSLGYTGGTIDKLESIPGYKTQISEEEFYNQIDKIGLAVCSQSEMLVPLDKIIYALRDVSGTTESIPLIACSIMSKKIASGASYIVIDVKVGSGALIKTKEEAEIFSSWVISIGNHYNKKVKTIITPMDEPLSSSIGNALEVLEAIEVLKGKNNKLKEVSVEIASHIVSMAKGISVQDAKILSNNALKKGSAYKMFEKWITTQGGDLKGIKVSDKVLLLKSNIAGTINTISALNCAKLSLKLGAGKTTKEDIIDHSVGIKLLHQIGDKVNTGDVIAEIYVKDYDIELTEEDLKLFIIK